MKEFAIKDFEEFLMLSDAVGSPFKFIEVSENREGTYSLKAYVWMRIALLSHETKAKKEELQDIVRSLKEHNFFEAEIKETPILVKP